jgi:MtN3 and saliva related transmembrane protein
MDPILIVGILAAVLTTTAFLPQVIKTAQTKHTKDISFLMYILFLIGVALWLIYGIARNELPIICANVATFILTLYILILKIKYG